MFITKPDGSTKLGAILGRVTHQGCILHIHDVMVAPSGNLQYFASGCSLRVIHPHISSAGWRAESGATATVMESVIQNEKSPWAYRIKYLKLCVDAGQEDPCG